MRPETGGEPSGNRDADAEIDIDAEIDADTEGNTDVLAVDCVPADMASDALAAARHIASGAQWPVQGGRRVGAKRSRFGRSVDPRYSGARADDRDPTRIGQVVQQSSTALGWTDELARARVFGQWATIVGSDIAAHCQPLTLTETQLRVSAESTAWAAQLRLMAPQILAKLTAELPQGLITKITFSGPAGPSWRRGPLSMSKGRGVRDTYG